MPIVVLTSGASWTVPSNWDSGQNTIECIGAGGAGGVSTEGGAPGGAGGAYARITNLALTPGASVDYHVGQVGSAAATVDTWFNGTSVATSSVGAKGAIGSTRGLASQSTGTTKYNGGLAGTSWLDHQGGGGGAGGPSGDGASGGSSTSQYGAGGGAADGGAAGSSPSGSAGGSGGASAHAAGGVGGIQSFGNESATHGGDGSQGSGGGGGGDYAGAGGDGGAGGAGVGMGDGSIGPGGGGGGVGSFSLDSGIASSGGLYGGGGGAGGGLGAQGVIVITYGPKLTAGAGSVVVAAQTAGIYITRRLTATASAVVIAAVPAALIANRRVIRPSADSVDGNWTTESGGTDLYASIDEVNAGDSDYIRSPADPVNEACKVKLSNPALGSYVPQEPLVVSYRYAKLGAAVALDFRVRLMQGNTEIASWVESDIGVGWVTRERTLTTMQFNSITDFTDLYLEFMGTLH